MVSFINCLVLQDDPIPRFVDSWILLHWILASVHRTWATWHYHAEQRKPFSEFGRAPHHSVLDGSRIYAHTEIFLRVLSRTHCADAQSWSANFTLGRAIPEIQAEICNIIENVVGDASLQTRVNVEQVLELTYAWARFLIQQRIRAYNDPIEQLGARLALHAVPYECGETLDALFGALHVVDPIRVTQLTQIHQRWSFFGRQGSAYYLSGPISIINHACHDHSNVVLKSLTYGGLRQCKLTKMVAIAERQILPGDIIYATYDNDSDYLFETRGIICNLCGK